MKIQQVLAWGLSLCLLIILSCSPKVGNEVSKKDNPTPKVESDGSASIQIVEKKFERTDKMPIDPNVRMGTLPNGMKYYIRRNQKPEQRAELRLAVNVGAMQDDNDQKGLAHFIEHLVL